jgi:hypothetical protein
MRAFRNRLEECIANDGHHFGDKIFKTWWQELFYISFLVLQRHFLYLLPFYRINFWNVVLIFGSLCICPILVLPFTSLLFELETYTNSSRLWIGWLCFLSACNENVCIYMIVSPPLGKVMCIIRNSPLILCVKFVCYILSN